MQRPPKARYVARDRVWLAALGEYDERRQRRRDIKLADEHGHLLREAEQGSLAAAAVERIWLEQEKRRRMLAGPTVTDIVAAYLEYQRAIGRKPLTIDDLVYHLERFCLYEHGGVTYGDRPAASIEVRDLARIKKSWQARGNKSGYIRHLYSAVLACWRWAVRPVEDREPERLIAVNPFDGVERPKPGRGRKLVLPWSTIQAILDFADARATQVNRGARRKSAMRALSLRLVAESGCRPKEVCDLEWDWVHEDEGMIEIPWEYHKTGWRDERERYMGFSPETAERLRQHRNADKTHPRWVFAPNNRPRKAAPHRKLFLAWFRRLREEAIDAGIPIPPNTTLYTLRRSFITAAKKGGLDFKDMPLATGNSAHVARTLYDQPDRGSARAAWQAMHDARLKADPPKPSTPEADS